MEIDVNLLRVAVTVVSFVVFIAIVVWAWSRRNQAAFDEAAQLPFQESRP
ncbi:MAG: CcoQ/FixQ family Cbb3-type cytochrome c oxidase assembly chaperone [Pseudorhodobacter sp.]|nr:CcoQ/FixQ family Cbb3-type cytochrome c oxidase assembly chaperone [Rhizobacter sp.]